MKLTLFGLQRVVSINPISLHSLQLETDVTQQFISGSMTFLTALEFQPLLYIAVELQVCCCVAHQSTTFRRLYLKGFLIALERLLCRATGKLSPVLSVHLISIMAITALLEVLHPLFCGQNFVQDKIVMSRGNSKCILLLFMSGQVRMGGMDTHLFLMEGIRVEISS